MILILDLGVSCKLSCIPFKPTPRININWVCLAGWDEGVLGMEIGEVARLKVHLAFLHFLEGQIMT